MERFIIIDGNAILHRAFHALPPLTTSKGAQINAAYGFTSMLLRVVHDLNPQYLTVTFDRPKPTFRKSIYVGYQAKRPKMDDGLSCQIEMTHQVVRGLRIPIFELDGYEADDLIGTISKQVKSQKSKVKTTTQKSKVEDFETIIVTGDRDILQLVDDVTKVYMPVKGISESKMYGEKEVEEKFGIKPSQFIDYKSLVGDASDNYPGVAGVGPKTAADLIKQFGTLEEIYAHLDKIENKKLAEKLAKGAEDAGMAKKLATIVRDTPVTLELDKCKIKEFDTLETEQLFQELEFRSLIPRLSGKDSKTQRVKEEKKKEEKKPEGEQTKLF